MAKLQPLKVPWKISPSTPHLGFSTQSFDGVNQGFVTFVGFLGEATKLHAEYGAYQQIAVLLESIICVRMYPEFSPDDSERLESYDWESIPEFRDDDGKLKDYANRFHDQWNATDICPNPAVYLVEDSDWLRRLGFRDDAPAHLLFHHYLFVGDDYSVEVVAKSLTWNVVASDANPGIVISPVCEATEKKRI